MPRAETVRKALKSIKRASDFEYFFENLRSPDWISPLETEGLFNSPRPQIEVDGGIRFPFWPQSQYLARMASRAPRLVMDTILKIPETHNVRIHEDFAEAALAMPAAEARRLVPKASTWIASPYQ